MLQPNQLKDLSLTAARTLEKHVMELPDAAVVTARALITAEERLRQRVALQP